MLSALKKRIGHERQRVVFAAITAITAMIVGGIEAAV